MQDTQVQSLVGKLRSHMPQSNQAHMPQLLGLHATTREPMHLSERPHDAMNTPHAATKAQRSQISILLKS